MYLCVCVGGSQAEMESRVELERRLKMAEEALKNLEQGLHCLERSRETDEKLIGDVSHLRSECAQKTR